MSANFLHSKIVCAQGYFKTHVRHTEFSPMAYFW